jgi:hypothetical protein
MMDGRMWMLSSNRDAIRFHPYDKGEKKKKTNGWIAPQAWYCKPCNKIIASFAARDAIL